MNLSFPGIALVVFDDLRWMSLRRPQLTVVSQPIYEVGYTTTSLLIERLAEPERPSQHVILKPDIHIRQTCGHEIAKPFLHSK